MPDDTIFAVSSGRPPAAIAVMRVSGPDARDALERLAGPLPTARVATLRTLRGTDHDVLDRALVLWFPGPASATGEDVAEFHLHGSIAIVAAVSRTLEAIGMRAAEPGEFTRRAVFNGRLDFNEAEGLADLLSAETETQRREAMLRATGALGRRFDGWTDRLLALSAELERAIDYDDDDIGLDTPRFVAAVGRLRDDMAAALDRPTAERLRDGVRVAIVGPVNAGKSSLFNALLGSDAAIVTDIAGTTRDAIERAVVLSDIAFVLIDTAGQRETDDAVERIGIERARFESEGADIVLDLSCDNSTDPRRLRISPKADLRPASTDCLPVSALTGEGLADLAATLVERARTLLPATGEVALNQRHRVGIQSATDALTTAAAATDTILIADHLGAARRELDVLTGRAGVDDVFDTLFSRFCLGK